MLEITEGHLIQALLKARVKKTRLSQDLNIHKEVG